MTDKTGLAKDHISFSQIKDFINCPRYYYIKYHEGKRSAESFALQFGSMQHAVVSRINEMIMKSKDDISFDDVAGIYDDEVKNYHFDPAAYTNGKENMRAYTLKTVAEKAIILKAEYPFKYKLKGGAVIEGRIDRVDCPGADQIEVIDFKSGALIPSNEELQRDLQLGIYAFIIMQEFPDAKEIYVSRQSLDCEITDTGETKGGYKKKVKKDIVQLNDVGDYLEMIWEKMAAEVDFSPNPDIAAYCQYCPEKCKQYFALLQERTGEARLDDINDIGKQFVQVKNQISAITAKEKVLKEMLKAHFDTNLKKDLIVGDKIIYVENCHKNEETKPRAAYDYTKIGVSNHFTTAGALDKIKTAAKKAKKSGILKN